MKRTIALVDDDRNILTSVSMALEAEGFRVKIFADGDEALRELRARPVDLAVLGGNPLILYPLALLSSLGVLSVLTTAYALVTIPPLAGVQTQTRWRGLIPAVALAFTLAVAQIGLIDYVRFLYTGTWGGFHL